jgi:hypothetical protein
MAFILRRLSHDYFFNKASMDPRDIKTSAVRTVPFCVHLGALLLLMIEITV